jgi:hypothetical protein
MLGRRLRSERRNTCRYGCCFRTKTALRRTKNERARDERAWKRRIYTGRIDAEGEESGDVAPQGRQRGRAGVPPPDRVGEGE